MADKDQALVPADEHEDYEDVETRRPGCSGCGWGLVGAAGCLGFPLMAIAVALFLGMATVGGLVESFVGIFRPEPRTATVETTRTILLSIRSQSQLVTTSARFVRSNVRVSIREGFRNACGFSASHNTEGTIEAGIDLNRITEEDIRYNSLNQTYTITLPPAQLTRCSIDLIQQYNRSFTVCNANWDQARQIAQYEALTGFRNDALEGGIIQRAQDDATTAMQNFVSAITSQTDSTSRVEILFAQPEQALSPIVSTDCNPDPPLGWTYDPAENAWSN